jgi:hypothetical protein
MSLPTVELFPLSFVTSYRAVDLAFARLLCEYDMASVRQFDFSICGD